MPESYACHVSSQPSVRRFLIVSQPGTRLDCLLFVPFHCHGHLSDQPRMNPYLVEAKMIKLHNAALLHTRYSWWLGTFLTMRRYHSSLNWDQLRKQTSFVLPENSLRQGVNYSYRYSYKLRDVMY